MFSFIGLGLYMYHHESVQDDDSAVYNHESTANAFLRKIGYSIFVGFKVIVGLAVIFLGFSHFFLYCIK